MDTNAKSIMFFYSTYLWYEHKFQIFSTFETSVVKCFLCLMYQMPNIIAFNTFRTFAMMLLYFRDIFIFKNFILVFEFFNYVLFWSLLL